MIKLIGLRRAMILAAALGVNVLVAGLYFFIFLPMETSAETERNGVVSAISGLQNDILNIKNELILFKENLPKYEAMKARGFFSEQDRFAMSRDLGAVREQAGIAGFSFNINDIQRVPNMDAEAAEMRLIGSRMLVTNVTSVTDVDFYRFLDLMQERFPTQVRLQSFSIRRSGLLNKEALEALAQKRIAGMVTAEAAFDWLTMVPAPPIDPNNPAGALGMGGM